MRVKVLDTGTWIFGDPAGVEGRKDKHCVLVGEKEFALLDSRGLGFIGEIGKPLPKLGVGRDGEGMPRAFAYNYTLEELENYCAVEEMELRDFARSVWAYRKLRKAVKYLNREG